MKNSVVGTSSGYEGGGKYQVFLSFHGRDTRVGFTSFLHRDLVNKGVRAFIDNEELRVGEEIGGALLQAIDDSQIYIPILSKNFTSSKWCLRELKRMVDNKSNSAEKKILPIFYDVKPDDLVLENSLYTTTKEKERNEEQKEKFLHEIESWEKALEKVDKTKGWELPKFETQAKLVDLVVEVVLQELKIREKSVTKDLIGLDDRMAEVLEKLDVHRSNEVRLLGIYGMGGSGKTTLARVVYNELLSHFGKCSAFLDDIRGELNRKGLVWLQEELLKEIDSADAPKFIGGVDHGWERIVRTLRSKKFLIVLDDVDDIKQIENLIGLDRLCFGTRIIITTRNIGVLETIKKMKSKNSILALQILDYEMVEMKFSHALQLFKRHALLEGSLAKDFDFDNLSIDIVRTTGCLPLALEVIGSLLYGEPKNKWENTLKQLKKMPHKEVQDKLRISFDALDDYQRDIFLDIACFFINEDITNATYMWESCEFCPDIEVLVRKSLIKMRNNKFWMHDQLRDLGREIVRRGDAGDAKNLKKWSRVWTSEEFLDFIRTEERYQDVEALDLRRSSHISISHEEIGRFKNLRFLRLSYGTLYGDFFVHLPKLRWISWHHSPPNVSVPSICSNNLVVLELFDNRFTDDSKVWDLIKMTTKLKSLSLVNCHCITRILDLSRCSMLERLTFDNCESLKEIDSSIGKLTHLHELNITNCKLVEHVPDEIGGLVKLERFSLRGCYSVSILPTSIGDLASLRKLDLSITRIGSLPESMRKLQCLSDLFLQFSGITEIPRAIEGLVKLQHLRLVSDEIKQLPDFIGELKSLCTLNLSTNGWLSSNSSRWKLPKAIGKLEKLEKLDLGHRKELEGDIPDEIGHLSSLRVLNLRFTKICRVPITITMLSCLSILDLTRCDEITELPELPTSLVYLHVQSGALQVVPNLSKFTNLVHLTLSDFSANQNSSNVKHKCDLGWIGGLSKLKRLSLYFLKFTAPVPKLGLLSLLEHLRLRGLDLQPLKQLPPSLLSLDLHNFSSTGSPLFNSEVLSNLTLDCSGLQEIQLGRLSQLQRLFLHSCELRSLSIPYRLQTLYVNYCPNMIEIQSVGMSASLEILQIYKCRSIGRIVLCSEVGSSGVLDQSESSSIETTDCSLGVLRLPNAFKKLKCLRLLTCENLLEIQVVSTLLSLQTIEIHSCDAMENCSGISNLKNLHRLIISGCSKLRVVEGLDELEFLTMLLVSDCPSLERLLDILNSKIPDECETRVSNCRKLLNFRLAQCSTFKDCRRMAQRLAPHSEENTEEAKMEGDAVKPDTKLQSPFYSSASSWDHEINEEPPFDNVREGTLRKRQNQTEEDLNRLDELAPPRTFCDRFRICLASILECVCNRDFPSIKAEMF